MSYYKFQVSSREIHEKRKFYGTISYKRDKQLYLVLKILNGW